MIWLRLLYDLSVAEFKMASCDVVERYSWGQKHMAPPGGATSKRLDWNLNQSAEILDQDAVELDRLLATEVFPSSFATRFVIQSALNYLDHW